MGYIVLNHNFFGTAVSVLSSTEEESSCEFFGVYKCPKESASKFATFVAVRDLDATTRVFTGTMSTPWERGFV